MVLLSMEIAGVSLICSINVPSVDLSGIHSWQLHSQIWVIMFHFYLYFFSGSFVFNADSVCPEKYENCKSFSYFLGFLFNVY